MPPHIAHGFMIGRHEELTGTVARQSVKFPITKSTKITHIIHDENALHMSHTHAHTLSAPIISHELDPLALLGEAQMISHYFSLLWCNLVRTTEAGAGVAGACEGQRRV